MLGDFRGLLPVVVDLAGVGELAGLVEEEDVGGVGGAVGFGDRLALVAQVGEVEALFFGAPLHGLEGIVGVVGGVVGVDGDELGAERAVLRLQGDHAVLVGDDVGAVVAGEDDGQGFL